MSIWSYLDYVGASSMDLNQKKQIEALELDTTITNDILQGLIRRIEALHTQVERHELVLESIIRLVDGKGVLARDELKAMLIQVDLVDGVEDGRIGPKRAKEAPMCANCHRPVNPRREHCVYCQAKIPKAQNASGMRPVPNQVSCMRCGTSVNETDVYFSERGMVCESCFS